MPAGGSCLLSSINLSAYVKNAFTPNAEFDFEEFKKDIPIYVKEMNVVLDEGLPLHPLKEQRDSVAKWRQIGLGILGLADMFIKLNIKYGSEKSVELSNKIGKLLSQEAIKASSLLAKEYGKYPGCDINSVLNSDYFKNVSTPELVELITKYGLRNSQILTIAPTGSISTMLGVSGGIEPIFAAKFIRTTQSLFGKDVSYPVYADVAKKCMDAYGIEEMPDHIVTAMDLNSNQRIEMQSTWQKYIDAAISSTINLPHETTVDQVFNIYINAWQAGLKGLTIYRSGCEREGILTIEQDDEEMKIINSDHICPDCGAELNASGGCFECQNCGWGKCSL